MNAHTGVRRIPTPLGIIQRTLRAVRRMTMNAIRRAFGAFSAFSAPRGVTP